MTEHMKLSAGPEFPSRDCSVSNPSSPFPAHRDNRASVYRQCLPPLSMRLIEAVHVHALICRRLMEATTHGDERLLAQVRKLGADCGLEDGSMGPAGSGISDVRIIVSVHLHSSPIHPSTSHPHDSCPPLPIASPPPSRNGSARLKRAARVARRRQKYV